MTLTIYNTLTRRKEIFESIEPRKVGMYYCGVTVYDFCHVGHARACIVWDTVRRYLRWVGYEVKYVQNFTDIDDKILNRANAEGSSMQEVADRYIQAYFEDMTRLNVMEADEYPRATHTIDGIKRLIHELEQKGFAYRSQGDVYYAVRQFSEYGKLSGRRLEDAQAGAGGRVDLDAEEQKKKDPADFALWKGAKPEEPAWESTWGAGRPGWHIECSAMVRDRLGDTIDIHAGGNDLIFPHHENEIAQSEAATGKPLARYWMHNGMVTVNGEKMSKSLGNFTTIRDLLDRDGADPMAVRLFVLQASYSRPLDFTAEAIASAHNAWQTLTDGLQFGYKFGQQLGWTDTEDSSFGNPSTMRIDMNGDEVQRFIASMDDDFNSPGAIAVLFELAKGLQKEGNRLKHKQETVSDSQTLRQYWQTLVVLAEVLGLQVLVSEVEMESTPQISVSVGAGAGVSGYARAIEPSAIRDARVQELIQERQEAKKAKNFAEADRIRAELKEQGIVLIDKPGGVTDWIRE
ncbi:cysteine--tRNA ligase [Microcoleus sp. FACHB-1515]|uniref:cysteine--tRNA ligase n=1 Tax=Cyanophyceae TaxID=3028117 RepID=UPI001689D26D|nr:cysteine--tRNA ligase [Microcoleus sp. FACHB-1515]MBD2090288.1 cysteine--tRNA ligase [Microcoleus sp. FACHB-1515]